MIYLTGDTHSEVERFASKEFPEGKYLNREDYVIILGDFGLLWEQSPREKYWTDWLNAKPWTTLFLDGNHENFDRLDVLPIEEKFGSLVGKYTDNIFHLRRGEIYDFNGKKFFVFGGGASIDKHLRVDHISWWARELPSYEEYHRSLDKLEENDWKVDYVLTHEAPVSIYSIMAEKYFFTKTPNYDLPKFLEEVKKQTKFKHWYFGHFHCNDTFDQKFTCLYEKVLEL